MAISEIFLLLFAAMLGITFGAGLYEARIVVPLWFTRQGRNYQVNVEALNSIDPGRKFWGMITTFPLTLLTFANSYFAFQTQGEIHVWWLTASLIILVERIVTFSFFIPTIIRLQKVANLSEAGIATKVSRWVRLNYIRNVATLIALFLTLKALTLI